MQSVSKPQRDALLKARRLLVKHPAAAAALNPPNHLNHYHNRHNQTVTTGCTTTTAMNTTTMSTTAPATARATNTPNQVSTSAPRFGSGVLASEHLERCVAFCVMCLDEKLYDELLRGGAAGAAGADAGGFNSGGGVGGRDDGVTRAAVAATLTPTPPTTGLSSTPMYLLRTGSWPLTPLLPSSWSSSSWPAANGQGGAAVAAGGGCPAPLLSKPQPQPLSRATLISLLDRVLVGAPCPVLCCNSKALLRATPWRPCVRGRLFESVRVRVQPWLRPQAVQVEMQVCWLLAQMEAVGMAVDTAGLGRQAAAVRQRMEALTSAASSLLGGRTINLGSSAQLAVVLYDELELPPPVPQGQRDAAGVSRTAVPGVTERAKQVVGTRMDGTAAGAELDDGGGGGGGGGRRGPGGRWNRLRRGFQWAVTKYEVVVPLGDTTEGSPCGGGGEEGAGVLRGDRLVVVARNAFVAPPGRLLVAADYSQIELRLLAHMSGDLRLQELLKRGVEQSEGRGGGGGGTDAFRHIAASWLRPGTAPADVSSRDREQVKRVVYGIIYGMTAQGLAQQLAEYGVGLEEATALRTSFLRHFAGVQAFITSSLYHARRHGYITTGLLGRRRPIAGVNSSDPRVVNSIVQIHDELVFEVDSRPEVVRRLVVAVREIMCGVVSLNVPLLVKVAAGPTWGALKELPPGFGE
ncbi:hypothetical protein VOLCADRAFT_94989 [Volvox carteri f. nagariensis]|uniref:DNA-directed DNA polymerase family A palm domain-containing protein n=1 Tax=Volvox carteri f. nagariensis TaxID=3068 RepID=D8U6B1_VOLCA|nr:uncharacterized protein VOLCADRAFT_94989 [Volvox carteri f. nagariensis]EFJ44683.1 hypothetical protein VOLCADRAFT_94989 [Volvox carteri f. nagariensis]|eukprot:XP_002954259.1 hypothetical protein VOLCADRAFT_94989 [Volvox carteri f. nagariensis]